MTPVEASAAVEAVLFVSGRPVSRPELARITERTEAEIDAALEDLASRYDSPSSGISLREVAGGFQLVTRPETAALIESYRGEARPSPLSAAALEVLSCVLYLGPLTRAGVSSVRGVNSDAVVRGLIERDLIAESGSESAAPGSATPLELTEDFFIASGSSSREDFPKLEDLVSEEEISRVRERVVPSNPDGQDGSPEPDRGSE